LPDTPGRWGPAILPNQLRWREPGEAYINRQGFSPAEGPEKREKAQTKWFAPSHTQMIPESKTKVNRQSSKNPVEIYGIRLKTH
jgi:hypothetical protein